MITISNEVAIRVFNILDELSNIENMDWARLGNFDGMTTEEFVTVCTDLLPHFDDPDEPTIC